MRPDPSLGIMRQFARETFDAIRRGAHLSLAQVTELLQSIAADPLDRSSRLAVLGANVASPRVRGEQILWFIEAEPFTSLGMYAVNLDEEEHHVERAAALWRRAVERWPSDLRVLENAVWFFVRIDHAVAVEMVDDRIRRSPGDSDTWELAAIVFDFVAAVDSENAKTWRERSVESAFKTFAEDLEPERRLELLLSMREAVSRVERFDVLEMLDLAANAYRRGKHLPLPLRGQAFAVALGFIALADGNNERAVRLLTDALQLPTASESTWLLAEALAHRGLRAMVCEQLALARGVLSKDAELLKEWYEKLAVIP